MTDQQDINLQAEKPGMGRSKKIMIGLASLGILVAAYLVYHHYSGTPTACLVSGGCQAVQNSQWSKLFGIPVALIGLVGYILILASLWLRGEWGRIISCALCFGGAAFSLYLTYHELFSVKQICQWCVSSQLIILALAVCSSIRLLSGRD